MYPKIYLYKRIKDAKILIDKYYSQNINLDNLCSKVYLSKYHFMRLFKEAYGITPNKYLVNKRIEVAKKLLQTDSSITNICYSVGFESVYSFSNLFKRQTGLSPSEFRKQFKNRKGNKT